MRGDMLIEAWPSIDSDGNEIRSGAASASKHKPDERAGRVVVLLDGGTIRRVLTDHDSIDVAVLDLDVSGCDEDAVLVIDGEMYAADALRQGRPHAAPDRVRQLYADIEKNVAARIVDESARPPLFEI